MTALHLGLVGLGRIGTMHAQNIIAVNKGGRLTLADLDAARAHALAADLGCAAVDTVEQLLASGIDALVIAAGTEAHPALIRAGVAAGIPVFCEKPVAGNTAAALELVDYIREHDGVVQIGHQRRFDAGYLEAKRAFDAGELGWIHSLRAITGDSTPPSIDFIAGSGGLFRDCSVHDFDILRWLTGREIVEVYAKGSNKGHPAIKAANDVDSALALVTFDDGTLASVAATRYNGGGHDVRLEVQGSRASLAVGLDEHTALRSAEEKVTFPTGAPHSNFMERFHAAYLGEISAFLELVRGERENPCTAEDAAAAARVADAAQESLATGNPVVILS